MKAIDVLKESQSKVSFPLTPTKIKQAGFEPTAYLLGLLEKLETCDDAKSKTVAHVIKNLHQLKALSET